MTSPSLYLGLGPTIGILNIYGPQELMNSTNFRLIKGHFSPERCQEENMDIWSLSGNQGPGP